MSIKDLRKDIESAERRVLNSTHSVQMEHIGEIIIAKAILEVLEVLSEGNSKPSTKKATQGEANA